MPELVASYLRRAVAPGTPLAVAAGIQMRGQIKVGRWVPFRAHELLNPHRGFVWWSGAAGVISGSDRFVGGTGAMDWRLFGIIPVMRAAGSDTSRSAAGRAAAEAVWVPTSLLPCFGVEWTTPGAGQVRAHYRVVDHQVDVDLAVTSTGLVRSVVFERWGDPDGTGTFGLHSFGGEFSDHATFNDMTIPVEGRLGWHYATDRWTEGEFFRFRVTDLEAVTDVHQ